MSTVALIFLLLGLGIVMALVSVGVLFGMSSLLGIQEGLLDSRVVFTFFVVSCIVSYSVSFGTFAGVQTDSCGEVKNWTQIALNAAIPLVFHVVLLSLAIFVQWPRNLVGNLFPPDTTELTRSTAAFAYYSFWAMMMGGALGGSFSGSCKTEAAPLKPMEMPLPMPELPEVSEASEESTLPPE